MRTLLTALVALVLAAPAHCGWDASAVDTHGTATLNGVVARIATDPAGTPGIALGGHGLTYLRQDPVALTWATEAVDTCTTRVFGLAFADIDRPVIGYMVEDVIRVATWNGATWDLLDVTVAPGASPVMALDPGGHPGVAFRLGAPAAIVGVQYARWNGAGWDLELVDGRSPVGHPALVGFNAAGDPFTLYDYWDNGPANDIGIVYSTWTGATWASNWQYWTLGPWAAYYLGAGAASAVGGFSYVYYYSPSDIVPFQAYLDGAPLPDEKWGARPVYDRTATRTHFYVNDGSLYLVRSFSSELITTGTLGTVSLAYDGSDQPVFAFALDNRQLLYAHRVGGAWQFDVVFEVDGDVGYGTSIAIAPGGEPAVSYRDATRAELLFAESTAGLWNTGTVASGVSAGGTSLAYDVVAGEPAIAYIAAGDLHVARRVGGSWVDDVVAAEAWWPSLAAAPGGGFAVAYGSAGGVHLARWDGVAWSTEEVDTFASLPSLAFDAAGLPAVAFVKTPGLYLARPSGPLWSIEEVVPGRASEPRLAFAPTGEPHIAFADLSIPGAVSVAVAAWTGGLWSLSEVAADLHRVFGIAMRSDAYPTVLFGDFSVARYASWDGVTWTSEIVDIPSQEPAFALDAGDVPVVSYRSDACDRDIGLYVARPTGLAALRRGKVPDLASPAWKAMSLPLTAINEEPLLPFPITVTVPGVARDDAPPAADLLLYRALWTGDRPGRNHVKLAASGGGIDLLFE